MSSSAFRYAVARIALFAMLFSVASPTLAASLFAHRTDVAARILGLGPAAPERAHKPVSHEHPATPGGHAAHASPAHEHDGMPAGHEPDGEHAAHGIYCSFCLTASSVAALVGGAPPAVCVHADAIASAQCVDDLVLSLLPLVLHARGPPPISRS